MSTQEQPIESAAVVWRYIKKRAGLDLKLYDADVVEVIAEMRLPLRDPVGHGRVAAIQPDFAVVKIEGPESAAVLIVECKQYLKEAPKRFREALTDYTRGAPLAQVILVNYGPAKHNITAQMPVKLAKRAHPIGEFRPDSPKSSLEFVEIAVPALRQLLGWKEVMCQIDLTWQAGPKDLDLYLVLPAGA